jgi:hypothetical protein
MTLRIAVACCCLLAALCGQMLHAQEESPELKLAREAYEREIDFATRPIRDRYLLRLETLKRSLGARGDARGALSIQEEIDRVKNSSGSGPGEGVGRFAGVWRITYADGSRQIFTIRADGSATFGPDVPNSTPQHSGKVTLAGSEYLLEFDDHASTVKLNPLGERMAVEVFMPKTAYPGGIPVRGTGVRLEHKP